MSNTDDFPGLPDGDHPDPKIRQWISGDGSSDYDCLTDSSVGEDASFSNESEDDKQLPSDAGTNLYDEQPEMDLSESPDGDTSNDEDLQLFQEGSEQCSEHGSPGIDETHLQSELYENPWGTDGSLTWSGQSGGPWFQGGSNMDF
ncbi:hypothetical protein ACHAPU_001044 [Fusarium lateritium]